MATFEQQFYALKAEVIKTCGDIQAAVNTSEREPTGAGAGQMFHALRQLRQIRDSFPVVLMPEVVATVCRCERCS